MQFEGQVEADRPVATFSKVKFRVQNLITELNRLRDREESTKSEVKQLLEAKELRTSLIGAELREQKFKRELATLLQSRSNVTEHLKVENHRLQLSLQVRSRELGEALDKLRRHGQLVEAVESEFVSLKRLVHEAHQIVREKEDNLARLQAKLDSVTCGENKLELLKRVRSLQKQLDDSCKSQLAKDMTIKTFELKLESGKIVDTLKEELSFARQVNKLKDSSVSRFQTNIQTLEIQICAMEIVVAKSQERLKLQEDLLESNRRELLETQDTARHLQASLQEAGKNLTNYAEACEKLESSTSQELRRSAELQSQLESILERYNSLETQQRNRLGLAEAVYVNEKRSLSTSTSDLITMRDKSTSTRDLQGEPGEGEDDLARHDLPNTHIRRPFRTEKSNANKKPPDIAEQSKCKKYKMKAKRDHIRHHPKRNPCPHTNSDNSISIEDLVVLARENDQVNLQGGAVTAKTGQAVMRESDAGRGDESCVSIVNHSPQPEASDYITHPEILTRTRSPDLEFDVEILLKQDLFSDVISPGRENNEWVYTDTEAGVTFAEDVQVPALQAEFFVQSCPGILGIL